MVDVDDRSHSDYLGDSSQSYGIYLVSFGGASKHHCRGVIEGIQESILFPLGAQGRLTSAQYYYSFISSVAVNPMQ